MIPIIEENLPEENTIQKILYPSVTTRQLININNINESNIINTNLKSSTQSLNNGKYDFQNGESFKGRIINGILQKGKYTWKNGQVYQGSFNSLNQFNGRGLITFPDLSTLSGIFTDNEIVKRGVYKTKEKTMEGTFYKNNLHGKFIIYSNDFNKKKILKNLDNNDDGIEEDNDNNNNNDNKIYKYKFIGEYYKGVKNGKFYLEKNLDKYHYVITGTYNKGKKNGEFSVKETNFNKYSMEGKYVNGKRDWKFNITDYSGEIIEKYYDQGLNIPPPYKGVKIEEKNCLIQKEEFEINCVTIIERFDKNIMILGIRNKISIYDFYKNNKVITFYKKINIFSKGEVNDIIETIDKEILICSSEAKIKLIKLNFNFTKNLSTASTFSNTINQDYEVIQEFKGLKESKNIFVLLELKNSCVVSGDCENIIIWEKNTGQNNNHLKSYSTVLEAECKKDNSILDSFLDFLGFKKEISPPKNSYNKYHSGQIKNNIVNNKEKKYSLKKFFKTSHTFSILEIKDNLIASPQPDSKSILFIDIINNDKIEEIKINKSISNSKNAMCVIGNKLLIVGFEGVIIIDINFLKYEKFIYLKGQISMICPYINDTFLCIEKNKIRYYQNEWSILQCVNHQQRKRIESVSKLEKEKFRGYVNRIVVKNIEGDICVFAVGKDESNEDDINKGKLIVLY